MHPEAAYTGGRIGPITQVGRIGCSHFEVRPIA
jgi:hypothetical protein